MTVLWSQIFTWTGDAVLEIFEKLYFER